MVLGTASHAGKSLVAAALCRIFANRGVRVAPFKAQNMSLNSAATPEGLEIGRAQAFQAEAARVPARADMNPVLLKPTSSRTSQVVLDGRMHGELDARAFAGESKRRFWPHVTAAYERLAAEFDLLIVEGAGSPAEINLRAGDIANMAVAHAANARALLLADIDRGGAFAAVAGTLTLLDAADRARIVAYAFNKFRGDAALLDPGVAELNGRIGVPCAGVIPFVDTTGLDEEDSLAIDARRDRPWKSDRTRLRVAVVALPHLANFTDFDALAEEPSVDLRYVRDPDALAEAHVAIVPGTKSTIADLAWLRDAKLDRSILELRDRRKAIAIGICGGMQMLGTAIDDPFGIEGGGATAGIGVFAHRSSFAREKTTVLATGTSTAFGLPVAVEGYEIHAGVTAYGDELPFAQIRSNGRAERRDGSVAWEGRAIGTYLHGIFAADRTRHAFLTWARERCGLAAIGRFAPVQARREERLDRLAATVQESLTLDLFLG